MEPEVRLIPDGSPSIGRIIALASLKAFGAFIALCACFWVMKMKLEPVLDQYRVLYRLQSPAAYEVFIDSDVLLAISGMLLCIVIAYLLLLRMLVWRRDYARVTVTQSPGFESDLQSAPESSGTP